jgi:dienelactone hydrolase
MRLWYTGANPGEVARMGSELANASSSGDTEAWYAAWKKLADRLWARAGHQLREGHSWSAGDTFLRTCCYYQWAIGFIDHLDPRRIEAHARSVEAFGHFAAVQRPPIERIEVPYASTTFPAWHVPSGAGGRSPAVIYVPGWDSTKEQGIELARSLTRRGIATLLCDGPGIGESVIRGIVNRHDYEVVGTAAFDYLAARVDVDPHRIGVAGVSLGGYRAARIAAFEHRLAGAVAWGAIWSVADMWADTRRGADALPTPPEHALRVMGAQTIDEVTEKLKLWTLDGVAELIRCPFLILHGEHDTQIPLRDAVRLYETLTSVRKELKIFTEDEGGATHCQNDNRQLAHDFIADWAYDTLVKGRRRIGVIRGEPDA